MQPQVNIDNILWPVQRTHEALVGTAVHVYPPIDSIVSAPNGSAATADADTTAGGSTITPDVAGLYTLAVGSEIIKLLAFDTDVLTLIPDRTQGSSVLRGTPEKRLVLRALASHPGLTGGTVAAVAGINLTSYGA